MLLDGQFNFGLPTITNSTTATASTNVYDAGSSKMVFGVEHQSLQLKIRATITADASPTARWSLVGSDNVDLDVDDNETLRNIILADSGTVTDNPATSLALARRDRLV